MDSNLTEWFSLLGRWAHIIFGISWIGSSFFFNWLDIHLTPPQEKKEGVTGELFLVHGGGYYQIQKKLFGSEKIPHVLHWFKWEAAWTLISGYFLLGLIYYSSGGHYLIDPDISSISHTNALIFGIVTLIITWFIYDNIWKYLGHQGQWPTLLTIALTIGASYALNKTLSGRAAYIHVGAMMGTWMVANVWMHIIPAQKKMLAQAAAGQPVDHSLGKQGSFRSKQNNYLTLPVIFIMISNHYPQTYGHELNWAILFLLTATGILIRHYFNIREKKDKYSLWIIVPVFISLAILIFLTEPKMEEKALDTPLKKEDSIPQIKKKLQDKTLNLLEGEILIQGNVPQAKKLKLPKKCTRQLNKEIYDNRILAKNGKLQNTIVWVYKGHENIEMPPPPQKAFELDQKGCTYIPRIAAVRAGQPVTFINSDSFFHNVKAKTDKNKSFNIGMPKKNSRKTKIFDKEEIVVKAKCSVHPWMKASIGVFKHPYFSISNPQGIFQIKDLPSGDYTVRAWHEVYGILNHKVSIGPGLKNRLTFIFKVK
jgi:uncharacterized membrane protein/plastocyanin